MGLSLASATLIVWGGQEISLTKGYCKGWHCIAPGSFFLHQYLPSGPAVNARDEGQMSRQKTEGLNTVCLRLGVHRKSQSKSKALSVLVKVCHQNMGDSKKSNNSASSLEQTHKSRF